MAQKKEISVEEKLRTLFDLQLIDSRVDEIRNVRGELPLEVEDLEDEVLIKTRIDKIKTDIETVNFEINAKKNLIEECKTLIKKYTEQQKMFVQREFNSLSKEIEYQGLESNWLKSTSKSQGSNRSKEDGYQRNKEKLRPRKPT